MFRDFENSERMGTNGAVAATGTTPGVPCWCQHRTTSYLVLFGNKNPEQEKIKGPRAIVR